MLAEDIKIDDVVIAPCYFHNKATNEYEFNSRRCFVVESVDTENSKCMLRSISTSSYEYSSSIKDFAQTGLDNDPSFIHCTPYNLAEFKTSQIMRKIGSLSQDDSERFMLKVIEKEDYQLKKELISSTERIIRRRKEMER